MQLRIFTEPQQGADYSTLLTVARATDELGFDAFFRSDHYLRIDFSDTGADAQTRIAKGLPGPTDAWITLAGLARETSRVRLGTLMSPVTFRYPGPLAIAVAQIDQMSGGRVELGLGAGWYAAEHAAYGIPFPGTAERFDLLEEQLQIVTGLWGTPEGKTFSFDGAHYALTDSPALPKPAQLPRPPILIGGGGQRRTPKLAARFADEFNLVFESPEATGSAYDRVREVCQDIGRDPASLLYSAGQVVCCGRTDAEVARRAAAIGQEPAQVSATGLGGSPSQLVDKIGQFAAVGAARMYLQVLDLSDLDHLELLASEVMPQVR
ncbi:MAG TPA: LLM class F420-dependent oxidoreductase [Streptosporangiaceae bacterium]